MQVFEEKMKRGESIDSYCTRSLAIMCKMDEIDEKIKVGMLINGMIPVIRDQIKIKGDLDTIEEVTKFARKMEKLACVQKSSTGLGFIKCLFNLMIMLLSNRDGLLFV